MTPPRSTILRPGCHPYKYSLIGRSLRSRDIVTIPLPHKGKGCYILACLRVGSVYEYLQQAICTSTAQYTVAQRISSPLCRLCAHWFHRTRQDTQRLIARCPECRPLVGCQPNIGRSSLAVLLTKNIDVHLPAICNIAGIQSVHRSKVLLVGILVLDRYPAVFGDEPFGHECNLRLIVVNHVVPITTTFQ